MLRIIEQDAFTDRLTGAEGDESDRAALDALLDRDRARGHDRHELPLIAFVKENRVGREALALDELGELMQRLFVDALEKVGLAQLVPQDRKSTRLNSSHSQISYAVFCLKKKKKKKKKKKIQK